MGMTMPGRNIANESVSSQGLDLLRADSLSLPNRIGGALPNRIGGGLGPRAHSVGSSPYASAAAAARMRGMNMSLVSRQMTPGFSPESKGTAANAISKKRKADGESDDDEDSGDKVFIPDIRELDILCGRGKSPETVL